MRKGIFMCNRILENFISIKSFRTTSVGNEENVRTVRMSKPAATQLFLYSPHKSTVLGADTLNLYITFSTKNLFIIRRIGVTSIDRL